MTFTCDSVDNKSLMIQINHNPDDIHLHSYGAGYLYMVVLVIFNSFPHLIGP